MTVLSRRRAELDDLEAARALFAVGTLDRVYLEDVIASARAALKRMEAGEEKIIHVRFQQARMFEEAA